MHTHTHSLLGSLLLLLVATKRIWAQCAQPRRVADPSTPASMTSVLPTITILALAISDVISAVTMMVQGTVLGSAHLTFKGIEIGQGWPCELEGFAAQAIQPMPFLWYSCICYSLFRVWHVIK